MKTELTKAMTDLASDPRMRFVGYGLRRGGANGTLEGVPREQIIETTVAENLMAGMAVGLSMAGLRPLVYFERFDFILNALDAIVNHMDKMQRMSGGEFSPAAIFRVTVGNRKKPRFTGITHTQNYSEALREMVNFPVVEIHRANEIENIYAAAKESLDLGHSTMVVEFKDLL